jgi:hypothetical protein
LLGEVTAIKEEDFMSNLSRYAQTTAAFVRSYYDLTNAVEKGINGSYNEYLRFVSSRKAKIKRVKNKCKK